MRQRDIADSSHICSLCGARLPQSKSCQDLCDELFAYTLALRDQEFIHQHAVDAYGAQHVSSDTKPIAQAATLIGLFLFAERGFTGRQVQQAHMKLGNRMKRWPLLPPPPQPASLTVMDVLNARVREREVSLRQWARAVWEVWKQGEPEIERRLRDDFGLA